MTASRELFPDAFVGVLRRALVLATRGGAGAADSIRHATSRVAEVGGFAGHRGYVPGDDARRVDWSAYARSGELVVKTFEDERGRDLTVLLDQSASMELGSRFDHSRRAAALVSAVLAGRGDRVRLIAQNGDDLREFTYAKGRRIDELLDWLSALTVRGTDADLVPSDLGRRARLIWISDFAEVDQLEDRLRRLGGVRRRALAVLPRVELDREILEDGVFVLQDVETGRNTRVRADRRLREQLRVELRRQAARRREAFGRFGVRFLEWDPPSIPELEGRRSSAADWLGGRLVTTILRHGSAR